MAKGETADLIGKLVGRYRIEKRLGSGGMGDVYLARQVEIGSRVAIKVMARSTKTDSEGAKRMFAEARAVNLVQHDRIVNVLDMTRIDGRPALIMEYLRGVSLDRLLASGPLPARCVADLAIDILDALAAVHAQEIYHRDLKPGNVYVSPEGRATLLDFGLAKMRDDMLGTVIQTQVGMVMGTVPYMAPEQSRGEPFTAESDIFAVGVLMYEAATARRPFRGHSIFELLKEHKEPLDRPRLLNPAVPESLEQAIMTALAYEPSERYKSAGSMRNAIIGIARGIPYESIRSRVEKFREASAAFIGVQPAFSNTPTVPDMRAAKAADVEHAPARRRASVSSVPPPPTSSSRTNLLLMGAAAIAMIGAIIATIFAFSLRGELQELNKELDTIKKEAREPKAAAVPSLTDWSLDENVSARRDAASPPIDASVPDAGPKRDPETDLRTAKLLLKTKPATAARLVRRAITNGAKGSRYQTVLAEAYCKMGDLSRFRSAVAEIRGSARRRLEERCPLTGGEEGSGKVNRDNLMNPFD